MDIIGCPVAADSSSSSVDEFSRSLRRKFKLIVTDMDDSLIKSAGKIHSVEADHKLSPRSRVLISLLREKRVGFAVITGARLESALYRYANELSPEDRERFIRSYTEEARGIPLPGYYYG